MNKMNLITLFLILFIVTVELCQCTNSSYICKEAERNALLKFKKSFNDPSGKLSSWQGMSCCDWEGVGCNPNIGYVVKLDLCSTFQYRETKFGESVRVTNMLDASKLDSSLVELRYLNYLDLSGNNFSGSPVPEFLGNLKGLKYLNFSHANFSRNSFPPQLGNLTNLQVFDVSSNYGYNSYDIPNHFTQSFEWLSTLSSLRVLYMERVNLSGVHNLVPMLSKLSFLSVLGLSECELDDSQLSPTTYANLTFLSSIQELRLSGNSFLLVPPLLKNMTSLRVLNLSLNDFRGEGNLFPMLNNFPFLSVLSLFGCELDDAQLSPTTHSNLTFLSSIQELDLSQNSLFSFPPFLKNMTSLRVLDISSNHFNFLIPLWLADLKDLEHLDLSDDYSHKVEGGLWRFLSGLCHLKTLYLDGNFVQEGQLEPSEGSKNISWGCIRYDLEVLSVSNLGLTGVLPNELCQFKKLTHIDLSNNALHGSIHVLLGNLTALIEINLRNNQLNGTIPPSIGNFSSLAALDLSFNHLTGSIHALFGNSTALTELHLKNNQLNGTIPSSIGNLSSLAALDLSNNQLSGVVPDIIGQLGNLYKIDVSSNQLTGKISETHFSNATKLIELILSSNQLTITITSDWKPPFQLGNLGMASCKIGPSFPRWIGTQKILRILDLSNASITGPWPKLFPNSNLWSLDLSHNHISGHIPHNIPDLWPGLIYLRLSDNYLNGTIPNSLCMGSFGILDISRNMLSGEIPNCWEESYNFDILNLSFNKFTGVIPSTIGNLLYLKWLDLNNNHLEGGIPSFLRKFESLYFLNLAHNKFSGNIPTWIGGMSNLEILGLGNNRFDGFIPTQLCQISSLRILDLGYNNFTGNVSSCLGNLTAMTIQHLNHYSYYDNMAEDIIAVTIKRLTLEYTNSKLVVNMDLSSNNLVGEIPAELTVLSGLLGLNLSNNHLMGSIPKNIGNLTALESLDLSNNHLSGKIPTGLSLLRFLSSLNLSENNFTGRIPTGNQLQTLTGAIYDGNPNLCGAPLSKRCPGDEPIHVPVPANEEEDKSDKVWLYLAISIGYTFGYFSLQEAMEICLFSVRGLCNRQDIRIHSGKCKKVEAETDGC